MSLRLRVPWGPGRETIKYADPLHAGRHPFQTYLLTLSVVSGIPLLCGEVAAGSVSAELPHPVALVWGFALFLGSIIALTGSYWRGNYANALTIERAGLSIAGSAGLAYAAVIMLTLPPTTGLVSACIVFGFGASCVVRARDIGRIIHRAGEGWSTAIAREGESDVAAAYRDPEPEDRA